MSMNKSAKIPAFTLSEMMVVLVITSIVITLAFSVLSLVTKQFKAINNNYKKHTELALFKQRLVMDFDRSSMVEWNPSEGILHIQLTDQILTYELENNRLIRAGDTIPFPLKQVDYYFKGQQADEGPVDALLLEFDIPGQDVTVFVQRRAAPHEQLQQLWD